MAIILEAHNTLRRRLGEADLKWDSSLAAKAADYAVRLAQTRRFEHSANLGADFEGENLWMGSRSAYNYAEMLASWSDESADFKAGEFPKVSRTGSWHDIGHYPQMIWQTTRIVGCAVAGNSQDDFLVCRYFPAGNIEGVVMRARP